MTLNTLYVVVDGVKHYCCHLASNDWVITIRKEGDFNVNVNVNVLCIVVGLMLVMMSLMFFLISWIYQKSFDVVQICFNLLLCWNTTEHYIWIKHTNIDRTHVFGWSYGKKALMITIYVSSMWRWLCRRRLFPMLTMLVFEKFEFKILYIYIYIYIHQENFSQVSHKHHKNDNHSVFHIFVMLLIWLNHYTITTSGVYVRVCLFVWWCSSLNFMHCIYWLDVEFSMI